MKYCLLIYAIIFVNLNGLSQMLTEITSLNPQLYETSGLTVINDCFLTINDSGNSPNILVFDTIFGQTIRSVVVDNATNVDWEAITHDSLNIYIGDIGNNDGNRTDLKIYKVSINDFINTQNDTVSASIISFNYANQIDFTPNPYQTNFDAESFVVFGDSLYVFTKNWLNNRTDVYAISKQPGSYSIQPKQSFNTSGLVTDAVFDEQFNKLTLLGYSGAGSFVYQSRILPNLLIDSVNRLRFDIPNTQFLMTEGICIRDTNQFYISNEKNTSFAAKLYRLHINNQAAGIEYESDKKNNTISIHYSSKQKCLFIQTIDSFEGYLTQIDGKIIARFTDTSVNCNHLSSGIYLVKIYNQTKREIQQFRFILE